jgi:hypothetical protein
MRRRIQHRPCAGTGRPNWRLRKSSKKLPNDDATRLNAGPSWAARGSHGRRTPYYRIASPLVAKMLEGIKAVAAIEVTPRYQPRSARDEALRFARTCYDHIAGHLGVAIADALTANGHILLHAEGGELTATGQKVLARLGADLSPASCRGRIFFRPCLGAIISLAMLARKFADAVWSCGGSKVSAGRASCG